MRAEALAGAGRNQRRHHGWRLSEGVGTPKKREKMKTVDQFTYFFSKVLTFSAVFRELSTLSSFEAVGKRHILDIMSAFLWSYKYGNSKPEMY
jgi:hypothetical protein